MDYVKDVVLEKKEQETYENLYKMLMPRVMKGLEKSTAFSLS